jgi:uncharacterized protein (TIRG00374 family)
MRSRVLGWVKLAAKFSFSIAILAYMIRSGRLDVQVVREGFSHGPALLGSAALVLLALLFSLYRWGLLMRGQGIALSLPHLFRYGMIGAFFNTTMPGAVSGDLIKAWYVLADRKGQRKTPVLASVLLDRVMGVFGLILVSASPLLLFGGTVWGVPALRAVAVPMLACFAGVLFFFAYVMLSGWGPVAALRRKAEAFAGNRVADLLLQSYDAWVGYRRHPWILAQSLLLSVGNFLCMVGVSMLCGHAIGETALSPYQYFLLVPIGLFTTAIPIAPAGLGVGQAAFHALFLLVGSPRGSEIFTMLVTLQILFNLTGVFFYLGSPKVVPDQALAPTIGS